MTTLNDRETTRLTTLPDPEHITLFFKFANHSVVLSVLSNQPFDEIKELFLLALRARGIEQISGSAVPEDKDLLEFGVLVDRKDATKGWVHVQVKEQDETKKNSGTGKKKSSAVENCPAAVGLTDGGYVAVRVRVEDQRQVKEESEDGADTDEFPEDPGWDVVLPTLEDE